MQGQRPSRVELPPLQSAGAAAPALRTGVAPVAPAAPGPASPSSLRRRKSVVGDKWEEAASVVRMREAQRERRDWRRPHSGFRMGWDTLIFVCVCLTATITPVEIAFERRFAFRYRAVDVFSSVSEVAFYLDLYLRMRKFAFEQNGDVVTRPSRITAHYVGSRWFWLDLCSVLPLRFLSDTYGVFPASMRQALTFNRLIRLARFFRYFRDLETFLARRRVRINSAVILFCTVFLLSIFLTLSFSCLYSYLACPGAECSTTAATWMAADGVAARGVTTQLSRAVYVATQTLFTVGYGDVSPQNDTERDLMVAFTLVGAVVYALFIAIMTSAIAHNDVTAMRHRQKLDDVAQFMASHDVPLTLRARTSRFFEFIFRRQCGMRDGELAELLPDELRRQMYADEARVVAAVPFFAHTPEHAHRFLHAFRPRTYATGEVIAHEGVLDPMLCVVRRGRVHVVLRDTNVKSVFEGEFFGDFQLVFGEPFACTYVAHWYTDLLLLDQAAFVAVLRQPPLAPVRQALHRAGLSNAHYAAMLTTLDDELGHHALVDAGELVGGAADADAIGGVEREEEDAQEDQREAVHTHAALQATRERNAALEADVARALEALERNLGPAGGGGKAAAHTGGGMGAAQHRDGGVRDVSPWVVRPGAKRRLLWDLVVAAAFAWTAAVVPLRVVRLHAQEGTVYHDRWEYDMLVDYCFDAVFWLEVVLHANFFGFFEMDEKGKPINVLSRARIRERYLWSHDMRRDVLTSLPWDLLGAFVGRWSLLRMLRLTKLVALPTLLTRLKEQCEHRGIHVTLNTALGLRLTIVVVLFVHYVSLLWAVQHQPADYLRAVYWALTTITTVGFGDIVPGEVSDTWFTIGVIVVGTTLTAGVIANIAAIVHSVVISEDNPAHVELAVEKLLQERELPARLASSCRRALQFQQRRNGGVDPARVLHEQLPVWAARDFRLHEHGVLLRAGGLFKQARLPRAMLRRMALLMTPDVVVAGDMAVASDEPLSRRFVYVQSGQLSVKYQGADAQHIGRGEFACAVLLFEPERAAVDVVALADSALLCLRKCDMDRLREEFGPSWERLRKLAVAAVDSRLASANPAGRAFARARLRDTFAKVARTLHWRAASSSDQSGRRGGGGDDALEFAPHGPFRRLWRVAMLLVALYNAVAVTFCLGFGEDRGLGWGLAVDYLGDLLLVVDFALHLKLFGFREGETLVSDPERIRARYLHGARPAAARWRGRAVLDALALAPLDVFVLLSQGSNKLRLLALLRLPRMLRLARVREDLAALRVDLRDSAYYSENAFRVSKMLLFILCVAHWLGCAWYGIAYGERPRRSWASGLGLLDKPLADKYVTSVYWAMATLTTVGYGDISAVTEREQGFSVFVLVVGTLMYTYVIANLEDIVAQIDVTSTLFQVKLDALKRLAHARRLPVRVQDQLLEYHENLWIQRRGVPEHEALRMLPPSLRAVLLARFLRAPLLKVPVFEGLEPDVLLELMQSMQSALLEPGDEVYAAGSCSYHLYVLSQGRLWVKDDEGHTVLSVGAPEAFGEGEFFLRELRCATMVAAESSLVYSLAYDAFWDVLRRHPVSLRAVSERLPSLHTRLDTRKRLLATRRNMHSAKMTHMLDADAGDEGGPNKATTTVRVFMPHSRFRRVWGILWFLATVSAAWVEPLRAAFGAEDEETAAGFLLAGATDLVGWGSVFLHLRHFAHRAPHAVLTRPEEFRAAYLRGRFAADALAVLPLDWLAVAAGVRGVRLLAALRFPRLLMLLRLGSHYQTIVDVLDHFAIHLRSGTWHCLFMFFAIVLACHWFCCAFFAIAYEQGLAAADSWTHAYPDVAHSRSLRYRVAVYWAAYTVTTVGFGSVPIASNAEKLLAIAGMLAGAVLCDAGLTAILTAIVGSSHDVSSAVRMQTESFRKYLAHRKVSPVLQEQVLSFFVHQSIARRGGSEKAEAAVLARLPPHLRHVVLRHVAHRALAACDWLATSPDALVAGLTAGLRPYSAVPREALLRRGEEAPVVYVVLQGYVALGTKDEQPVSAPTSVLSAMSVVGNFRVPDRSARALSFCELYALDEVYYRHCEACATHRHALRADAPLPDDHPDRREGVKRRSSTHRLLVSKKLVEAERRWAHAALARLGAVMAHRFTRAAWPVAALGLGLFAAVAVPYRAAFAGTGGGLWAPNVVSDAFFLLDFVARAALPPEQQPFPLPVPPGEYLDSWWVGVDVAALFPLELLAWGAGAAPLAPYRLLTLARVPRLYSHVADVHRRAAAVGPQNPWAQAAAATWAGVLLLAHWLACLAAPGDYSARLVWALSALLTLGYGGGDEQEDEDGLAVATLCLAPLCVGAGVAAMLMFASTINVRAEEQRRELARIDRFVAFHQLPPSLAEPIRNYGVVKAEWGRYTRGLPPTLTRQVDTFRVERLLRGVDLLRRVDAGVLSALLWSGQLVELVHTAGDTLLAAGAAQPGCFVVAVGSVAVRDSDDSGKVAEILGAGDSYGSSALFLDPPPPARHALVTQSYCEAYLVPREALAAAWREHGDAEAWARLQAAAQRFDRSTEKWRRFFGEAESRSASVPPRFRHLVPGSVFRARWDLGVLVALWAFFVLALAQLALWREPLDGALLAAVCVADAPVVADQLARMLVFCRADADVVAFEWRDVLREYRRSTPLAAQVGDALALPPLALLAPLAPGSHAAAVLLQLPRLAWRLPRMLALQRGERPALGARDGAAFALLLLHGAAAAVHAAAFSDYNAALRWTVGALTRNAPPAAAAAVSLPDAFALPAALLLVAAYAALTAGALLWLGVLDSSEIRFASKMARLRLFLEGQLVPAELCARVRASFAYINAHQRQDDLAMLNALPGELRERIASFAGHALVSRAPALAPHPALVSALVHRLESQFALPGDLVVKENELGDHFYFVRSGRLEVVSAGGDVVYATLGDGAAFGETGLLAEVRRGSSVRAASLCELLVLSRDDFDAALAAQPPAVADSVRAALHTDARDAQKLLRSVDQNLGREKFQATTSPAVQQQEEEEGAALAARHPQSRPRRLWARVVAGALGLQLLLVPARVADVAAALWLDYVLDLVLLADVALRAGVFWHVEARAQTLVKAPAPWGAARRRHLLASLPVVDLAVLAATGGSARWTGVARLPRLAWAGELPARWWRVSRDRSAMVRRALLLLCVTAHYAACLRLLCSGDASYWRLLTEWAVPVAVGADGGLLPLPDNSAAELVALAACAAANALFVGRVAERVATAEVEQVEFLLRSLALRELLAARKVPATLRERAEQYLDWLWRSHGGHSDGTAVLAELPGHLRAELSKVLRERHVRTCPLFDQCSQPVVTALATRLESALFSLGDVVVSAGEPARELFFVVEGGAEVLDGEGRVLCLVPHGNVFGESALFERGQRRATVRASDFSEMLLLSRDDFERAFEPFPAERALCLAAFQALQRRNVAMARALKANLDALEARSLTKVRRLLLDSGSIFERVQASLGAFLEQSQARHNAWDATAALALLFVALVAPARIAFGATRLLGLDWLADALLVADTLLRWRWRQHGRTVGVGFVDNRARLRGDADLMLAADADLAAASPAAWWRRSRAAAALALAEALACVPWDLLMLAGAGGVWLRAPHLLHLARARAVFKDVEVLLQRALAAVGASLLQAARAAVVVLVSVHWAACVYGPVHGEGSYGAAAFRAAAVLSTAGYGVAAPEGGGERLLHAATALCGGALVAYVIGSLVNVLQGLDAASGALGAQQRLRQLDRFLAAQRVPAALRRSVVAHQRAALGSSEVDESALMRDLPRPLRMELALCLRHDVMCLVPAFRHVESRTRKHIALELHRQVLPANSFVYQVGDIGEEVYFVEHGIVRVTPGSTQPQWSLGRRMARSRSGAGAGPAWTALAGATFGAGVLRSQSGMRAEAAQCVAACTLFFLTKEQYAALLPGMRPPERQAFVEELATSKFGVGGVEGVGGVGGVGEEVVDSVEEEEEKDSGPGPGRGSARVHVDG